MNKREILQTYKIHDADTGSVEVQIALLTKRINELNEHLKIYRKDYSSKHGLMKLVGQRRRFLQYLKSSDESKYHDLIDKLGIRG